MENKPLIKGRGAQVNTQNSFEKLEYITDAEYVEYLNLNGEDTSLAQKTKYLEVYPKSILNKIDSPDVGRGWSLNPYQGCEHGCIYCYARNTHEYWGYSAGTEFEENILVKKDAPRLLKQHLQKRSWIPEPIMLSGNTDCYQVAEQKFGLTRKILEVCLEFKQPVALITKNALVLRDLDLLQELAKDDLIRVNISITTLQEDLRRKMEPRTATSLKRIEVVKTLAEATIPVNIMMAPVIPGLNSHEIMNIAKASSSAGASSLHYSMVRLNGKVGTLFENWVNAHYPDKAKKVINLIKECHEGKVNDSVFGRRMTGSGTYAQQIKDAVALAQHKYFKNKQLKPLKTNSFIKAPKGQYSLF